MTLPPFKFSFWRLLAYVGPGFLMSIAYLDPGNIAGNVTAGIAGGYSLLWVLLWSTLLGLWYQSMAARIGCVTQRNMAKLCAQQYSTKTRYMLWIMTEFAIIGSDIQEVLGSATAIQILSNGVIPLYAGAIITIFDSFLFLFIHYFGIRKLEAFFLFLIAVMAITFCINFFACEPSVKDLAIGTIVPIIPSGSIPAALGLVGAVIMPHNIYLHSALVLTRKIEMKDHKQTREAIIYNNIESGFSLFISFIINTMVIATFAEYVKLHPGADSDLDLGQAAVALESLLE